MVGKRRERERGTGRARKPDCLYCSHLLRRNPPITASDGGRQLWAARRRHRHHGSLCSASRVTHRWRLEGPQCEPRAQQQQQQNASSQSGAPPSMALLLWRVVEPIPPTRNRPQLRARGSWPLASSAQLPATDHASGYSFPLGSALWTCKANLSTSRSGRMTTADASSSCGRIDVSSLQTAMLCSTNLEQNSTLTNRPGRLACRAP